MASNTADSTTWHPPSVPPPPAPAPTARRASLGALAAAAAAGPKAQRTSKTSQRLVVLPSAVQTKPLPGPEEDPAADNDALHGYETDAGVVVREAKSTAERMSKDQRKRAGYRRITAYCVADEFRPKLLASFLKREHNVVPRVYDDAIYAIYQLPLLPGYGPNVNIRSSAHPQPSAYSSQLSDAEDLPDDDPAVAVPPEHDSDADAGHADRADRADHAPRRRRSRAQAPHDAAADAVFFAYGVAVFFGLAEAQERAVLEDLDSAGVLRGRIVEEEWEVEECHFAIDPSIANPRIYNDFFTFKSPSPLLKLSVAHALAQSTLLARYEARAGATLAHPRTLGIPRQLAAAGTLSLRRRDALKLTGRLFKLRRDLTLLSPVLSSPSASLPSESARAYAAAREYMEIRERAGALNARLADARTFLDAIHQYLDGAAMERITWIVIWLIVVACLVEVGEVIARLVVHVTTAGKGAHPPDVLSREDALRALERIIARGR